MYKFKEMVGELRDRENEASRKAKKSLEILDQMKDEKAQVNFILIVFKLFKKIFYFNFEHEKGRNGKSEAGG